MLRDNKPTIPSPNCWSLLGGAAEEGETPLETLKRELKEEANIDAKDITFLGNPPSYKNTHGGIESNNSWYLVKLTDEDIPKIKLGDEGQELKFMTLEELEALPNKTQAIINFPPVFKEKILRLTLHT